MFDETQNPENFPFSERLNVYRFTPRIVESETKESAHSFKATRFEWRDPSEIPPRDFLFGNHFVRRFVSGTAAPGGVGKSFLAQSEALSMVSGLPILGTTSRYASLNVWYWNLEDPFEEIERRFAAAAQFHGVSPDQVLGKLFVSSGRRTPLVVAIPSKTGVEIVQPVVDNLLSEIETNKIDVIIIDPFISSHNVPENDNVAIDAVVKLWGKVAEVGKCAVELIHHTKKMGGEAMSEESFRGAKSLVDGLRSARVLHPMTESDATKIGVSDGHRGYFHTMSEKQSLAPAAHKRTWYKLNSVSIPNGDNVAAVSSWTPPDVFADVTVSHLNKVQALFRQTSYRESDQAAQWGGYIVADVLGIDVGKGVNASGRTPTQKAERYKVKRILAEWITNGAIGVEKRVDPERREEKMFFCVPDEA